METYLRGTIKARNEFGAIDTVKIYKRTAGGYGIYLNGVEIFDNITDFDTSVSWACEKLGILIINNPN